MLKPFFLKKYPMGTATATPGLRLKAQPNRKSYTIRHELLEKLSGTNSRVRCHELLQFATRNVTYDFDVNSEQILPLAELLLR